MIDLVNLDDDISLHLSIVGYEFPDDMNDNWCNVKVFVRQGGKTFEAFDPCLDARELLSIFDWFNCLSEKTLPTFATLCFTEPCIEFQFLACRKDAVRILIPKRQFSSNK